MSSNQWLDTFTSEMTQSHDYIHLSPQFIMSCLFSFQALHHEYFKWWRWMSRSSDCFFFFFPIPSFSAISSIYRFVIITTASLIYLSNCNKMKFPSACWNGSVYRYEIVEGILGLNKLNFVKKFFIFNGIFEFKFYLIRIYLKQKNY